MLSDAPEERESEVRPSSYIQLASWDTILRNLRAMNAQERALAYKTYSARQMRWERKSPAGSPYSPIQRYTSMSRCVISNKLVTVVVRTATYAPIVPTSRLPYPHSPLDRLKTPNLRSEQRLLLLYFQRRCTTWSHQPLTTTMTSTASSTT
jgi:hypothetical protein